MNRKMQPDVTCAKDIISSTFSFPKQPQPSPPFHLAPWVFKSLPLKNLPKDFKTLVLPGVGEAYRWMALKTLRR